MFFYTAPGAFGLFFFGVYLQAVRNVEWAATVAGLSAVVVFGALSGILQRFYLSRVRCPQCGSTHLEQTEDASRQQLLVCRDCKIEWDTGISNDISTG